MILWSVTSTIRLFLQRWILFCIQEHVQAHLKHYKQKKSLSKHAYSSAGSKVLIPATVCTNVAQAEPKRREHSTLPTHKPTLTFETNTHTFRKDCT